MDNYQKRCPIDGGTCGQGGTCFVCENEALGSHLAAAEARFAELKAEYTATIEASARQAKTITDQQKRIASLENALEPFARSKNTIDYFAYSDDYRLFIYPTGKTPKGNGLTIADLRRAAAMLKDKD